MSVSVCGRFVACVCVCVFNEIALVNVTTRERSSVNVATREGAGGAA